MSPLDLVKRATLRKQRLSEAQLTHLRSTAYRGVDTSAHLSPTIARASWSIDCRDGNNGGIPRLREGEVLVPHSNGGLKTRL